MNSLERALCDGATKANHAYVGMTENWLSHGPEAILTCFTGKHISHKTGMAVCIDFSPKRIEAEKEKKKKGRKPRDFRRRFDMVVWHKTSLNVRAIIEVKRAYNRTTLRSDRKKLSRYISKNDCVAYLLAYTEAKGSRRAETLESRRKRWPKELGCDLVGYKIHPKGDGRYGWAIYVMRVRLDLKMKRQKKSTK